MQPFEHGRIFQTLFPLPDQSPGYLTLLEIVRRESSRRRNDSHGHPIKVRVYVAPAAWRGKQHKGFDGSKNRGVATVTKQRRLKDASCQQGTNDAAQSFTVLAAIDVGSRGRCGSTERARRSRKAWPTSSSVGACEL